MRNEGRQRGRPRARGLGPRLVLAGLAAWLILIPFSLLLVVAKLPLNDLDAGVAAGLHAYVLDNPGVTRALIVWTDAFGPWPWRIAVIARAPAGCCTRARPERPPGPSPP
ncbi:hypothetical protein ACFQQB_42130 [Nonomuraea rubra]|uniref:hypothetical protein n=1 Tax=Nonomuraea rubra TaxID=46180 RepID=UPI003617C246